MLRGTADQISPILRFSSLIHRYQRHIYQFFLNRIDNLAMHQSNGETVTCRCMYLLSLFLVTVNWGLKINVKQHVYNSCSVDSCAAGFSRPCWLLVAIFWNTILYDQNCFNTTPPLPSSMYMQGLQHSNMAVGVPCCLVNAN